MRREGSDHDPVLVDGVHHPYEMVELDRFLNISIGAEIIASEDILLTGRDRQYDDRDRLEGGVALDLLEDLQSPHLREVEIEQNDSRTGSGRRIGEFPLTVKKVERLLAVPRHIELVPDLSFVERSSCDLNILKAIFYQENFHPLEIFFHNRRSFFIRGETPGPSESGNHTRGSKRFQSFQKLNRALI